MNSSQQSLTAVYRQLLRQILSQGISQGIPEDTRNLWNSRRLDGYGGLSEQEAKNLLLKELKKHQKKFVIADALDEAGECAESIHSELSFLRENAGCAVFSTTRQNPREKYEEIACNGCGKFTNDLYWQCTRCIGSLGRKFDLCRECYQVKGKTCNNPGHTMSIPLRVNIEVSPSSQEIQDFVTNSLQQELDLDDSGYDDEAIYGSLPPNLKRIQGQLRNQWDTVPEQIRKVAGDSYLVADLLVRRLKAQVNIDGFSEILQDLQSGASSSYDDQYKSMLDLCVNSGRRESRKVAYDHLALMSATQTILSFDQLSHATAIRSRDVDLDDFSGRCCTKQTVRKETHGLLSIGDFGDPDNCAVTFFHETLSAYLKEHGARWFQAADQKMFNACCAYLQLDAFRKPFDNPKALDKTLSEYPFASYAAIFWGVHLRKITPSKHDVVAVLEMFNNADRKKAILQIARHVFSRAELAWDVPGDVGALHICAFQGLPVLCQTLIDDGEDVNAGEDTHGQTALHYACRRGHTDVVKILLKANANPNVASGTGKTPLMETIEANHVNTFDLLLRSPFADVNAVGGPPRMKTALHLAAETGKTIFVERLLQHHRILINKPDSYNITALTCAVRCPNAECVALLLDQQEIDMTVVDDRVGTAMDNITTLSAPNVQDAAIHIAELFLQHPQTPLIGAGMQSIIEENRVDLLHLFLNQSSYESWRDEHERTLLHIAAGCGNLGALQLVMDHFSATVSSIINSTDNYGRTPLHAACTFFCLDSGSTALSLLEKSAAPLKMDSNGFTAVDLAYQSALPSQRDEIAQIFERFCAPRSIGPIKAHKSSYENIVRFGTVSDLQVAVQNQPSLVLEEDPYTGWTALHMTMCASIQTRPEMLNILLPKALSYMNATDKVKQTCLHAAATRGCVEGIKILIDARAELDIEDKWGETAFDHAQKQDDKTCSLLLINAGAQVKRSSIARDLIHNAVTAGDVQAVKKLIDVGVDIHFRRRGTGPTPLFIAKDHLRVEVNERENDLLANRWRDFSDMQSLIRTAHESQKAKDFQQIIDYLQEAESQRGRRPSTFPHRDLTPLIRRLQPDEDRRRRSRGHLAPSPNRVAGTSPPPSYDRVLDEDVDVATRANSFRMPPGLGLYKEDSGDSKQTVKSILDLAEGERIAIIIVIGIVAIAWMWLLLHYYSSSNTNVLHEL